MANPRSVATVALVLVFLSLAPLAAARTWTSHDAKFTIEATLVDFNNGQLTLKKTDGSAIHVPLAKLCEADQQFVKEQYPNAAPREWKSADGRFSVRAAFVECRDGKVRLRKNDGQEIDVPLEKLSTADQSWVEGELSRRGKTPPVGKSRAGIHEEQQEPTSAAGQPAGLVGSIAPQTIEMKLVPLKVPKSQKKKADPLVRHVLDTTSPQGFLLQTGQASNPQDERFRKIVQKEPTYAFEKPLRGVVTLAARDYAFALDATGKEPKGFNRLYFDADHNGDLTNDRVLSAEVVGDVAKGNATCQFADVRASLEIDGVKGDHTLVLGVHCLRSAAGPMAIVQFRSASVREGQIDQGGRKVPVLLVDKNSNGRFDDRTQVIQAGTRMRVAEGDLLLVDPRPGRRRALESLLGRDRQYVNRMISLGERFYTMDVSATGDRLKLEPADMPLGYVTNASPAYRAVVCNDEHGALMIGGTRNQRIALPEGEWKMASVTIVASNGAEPLTLAMASSTNKPSAVTIVKDQTAELCFGGPFRPVVTAGERRDNKVPLSLVILGKGGEQCTSMLVKGQKPPKPKFQVRDKDGKVVYSGQFEYG